MDRQPDKKAMPTPSDGPSAGCDTSLVWRLLNVLVDVGSTNQLLRPVPHGEPCCRFLPGRGMCIPGKGTLKGGTMTGGKAGMAADKLAVTMH
ncbi:hypothetical protein INR49_027604 [Caranx melampygus]|nr:hypothetical protein INR49_027604 [Caranx melampygus]